MEQGTHEKVGNLPNALTIVRLACIPVVFICLNFPGRFGSFLAALSLGLAFITDILDGFFARKYGKITVFGKFLDPLADKILIS
ncbi:MAG: CDP-alcohol phosphatidyltransferase family protein, partial [Thermodesulfobacteriota bacterium]|nr:CDP-alcohol phosphatidyltransferase family protein [Thermodesulfobacteriota bacterium]